MKVKSTKLRKESPTKKEAKYPFAFTRAKQCLILVFFCLKSESKMEDVYKRYRAPDGFLYLKYAEMEKF